MSDLFDACIAIGCSLCGGDGDCPCVHAYATKYGAGVDPRARHDLDVWFPRAHVSPPAAPVTLSTYVASLEASHDRMVVNLPAIRDAAEAKNAKYARAPRWVIRKKKEAGDGTL